MARRISVEILGDSRSLERAFSRSTTAGRKWSASFGTFAKGALIFTAVERAVDAATGAIRAGAGEFSEAARVSAQTNAAIQSTGGVANVTARQVAGLAGSLSQLSGVDDELIQKGSNLLLTFKNVRNEAGKGNAIFDRATKAALDLSVAGFGSMESTSKQLGKALNDPVKGMTALGRAGVTFTKGQRDTIKALVESGRVLEAQKLILEEVESQVGGSARALGQTLPGQLNRLRESLLNTLGSLAGRVAPVLRSTLGAVNDFVADLGAARTVRAKLTLVFDRVVGVAESIADRVGDAVASIDWDAIWARARGVGDGLQRRLEAIDFAALGRTIGDGFADAVKRAVPAVKDLAERVSDAVASIDFVKLGKAMGPGLAAAVVTAFVTLLDPAFWAKNWDLALAVAGAAFGRGVGRLAGRVVAPLGRLGASMALRVAAAFEQLSPLLGRVFLSAVTRLPALVGRALTPLVGVVSRVFQRLNGIAGFVVKVFGLQVVINAVAKLVDTVAGFFSSLGGRIARSLELAGKRAALALIEPFTHLPDQLPGVGGWIDSIQELKARWEADLNGIGAQAEKTANRVQRAIDGVKGKTVKLQVDAVVNAPGGPRRPEEGAAGQSVAQAEKAATKAASDVRKQAAATRKTASAAKESERASKQAVSAAEKARQAFATLMERLTLRIDQASVTRGFADDLRAIENAEKAVLKQIRAEGRTVDLERQLFEIRQRRADVRKQIQEQAKAARDARQFRALSLDATGGELAPSVRQLRGQLASVGDAVRGTFLDTGKTRSLLANIRRVLSGGLGRVSADVRRAVRQMLDDIDQQLGEAGGRAAKRSPINANKILAGIGLSPDQLREARQRLNQLGASAVIPSSSRIGGAFGLSAVPARASSGGGGVTVNLYGDVVTPDSDKFLRDMERRAMRNTGTRSGIRAGSV